MQSHSPVSGSTPRPTPAFYSSTPPPPPPKPPGSSTPSRGPPLPPPPPGQYQPEASELDGTPAPPGQHRHPQSYVPPIDPSWIPESLKDKSTVDLQHLLDNQDMQAALLSNSNTTHPAIPAAQQALEPIIENNIALADSVLRLEARLKQQREQTQSRLLALRALEQQHRGKTSEAEDALRMFSPPALYQRLSASVQEQEQLVRGIEESWLEEGGLATDRETTEFVRRVKENKKLAFLKAERKKRWDEGRVGGWR